jgi:hypothetical protein
MNVGTRSHTEVFLQKVTKVTKAKAAKPTLRHTRKDIRFVTFGSFCEKALLLRILGAPFRQEQRQPEEKPPVFQVVSSS